MWIRPNARENLITNVISLSATSTPCTMFFKILHVQSKAAKEQSKEQNGVKFQALNISSEQKSASHHILNFPSPKKSE